MLLPLIYVILKVISIYCNNLFLYRFSAILIKNFWNIILYYGPVFIFVVYRYNIRQSILNSIGIIWCVYILIYILNAISSYSGNELPYYMNATTTDLTSTLKNMKIVSIGDNYFIVLHDTKYYVYEKNKIEYSNGIRSMAFNKKAIFDKYENAERYGKSLEDIETLINDINEIKESNNLIADKKKYPNVPLCAKDLKKLKNS